MSAMKELLAAEAARFKQKMSEQCREIAVRDHGWDSDLVLYFYPTTVKQGDAILRYVGENKYLEGYAEAIFQRARFENGQKAFTSADRPELLKQDPEVLTSIGIAIGAFEDIQPDIEGAAKNSDSTGTSKIESS